MTNQNEVIVKMVLDAWNAKVKDTNKLLAEITDEQLQKEIAPNRNRGVYLLGHLTAVNDKLLPLLGLGEQQLPQLNEAFLSKADKAVSEIPSAADLRNYWKSSTDTLANHFSSMQAEEWFDKHTAVSAEDFAIEPHRNRLNVIISRTSHLAYHGGQIALLKN